MLSFTKVIKMQRVIIYRQKGLRPFHIQVAVGRNGLIMVSIAEFLTFVQPSGPGLRMGYQILVTASNITAVSSDQWALEPLLPAISNVFPPCQAWGGWPNEGV